VTETSHLYSLSRIRLKSLSHRIQVLYLCGKVQSLVYVKVETVVIYNMIQIQARNILLTQVTYQITQLLNCHANLLHVGIMV